MIHPEYTLISTDAPPPVEETLTPVYPATEGVHQLTLRNLTTQALAYLGEQADERVDGLIDWLPAELIAAHRLASLPAALHYVHRPPPNAPMEQLAAGRHPSQQQLAFEELLAHHLSLRRLRQRARQFRRERNHADHIVVRQQLIGRAVIWVTHIGRVLRACLGQVKIWPL